MQQKFGNFETDEIDITLCNAIEEHYRDDERADSLISQYIKAINNTDKSELPFKLVYNFNGLKDLKKEGFLTRTASSKLLTVADFVKEYELGEVQKEETGLKRVINSVKRFFTKREFRGNIDLLTEGEELRKVKILFQNGTYSLECGESKGKKYGDIYMYEAKCKIDDYDEIDKVEEEYDIRLSNKDISRFDITIYKLLKNLESLNIRAEDRDLNNLAEGYLKSIISKELSYEVENLLDITYDLGCFEYISEDILSDYDLKQLKKKSKYAEKIGIAKVEYNDNEEELSEELISNLNNSGYFCKIADETDLDEQNKMALERLNEKIKNKSGVEGDEESIVKEIAKENGISLKVNNIVKSLQQLKVEILDKKLKENN